MTYGHEWQAVVSNRTRGRTGCPQCFAARRGQKRRKPLPGHSLQDEYPEVAAEWHPTGNDDLLPEHVRPFSNIKFWWQCACGFEWQEQPNKRSPRGPGCKHCRRRTRVAAPPLGKSLADVYPKIAAQWHPTRNSDLLPKHIRPGSNVPRWWLCEVCGHQWETKPAHRTCSGSGCPPCSARTGGLRLRTPTPGQSLADRFPAVGALWHPRRNGDTTPLDIRPGTNYRHWWHCKYCGREWQTSPKNLIASAHVCRPSKSATHSIADSPNDRR